MRPTILSRYLDPAVLVRMAGRHIEPRSLVVGNLAGMHKSPLAGFAVEFASHREYVPGDDPKHIDWRVYFTRDKYFVKQYEMETNFVCHLIVDCSASMRYGQERQQKLQYAAQMAATIGYLIIRQSDKVSLATFDDRIRGVVPPSNSMAQIVRMADHLSELQPTEKTNMAKCLSELVGHMKQREIVIIFSDFFADLSSLEIVLQRMRFYRHEIVLFQIMHHDELTFDFDSMTKFRGLEISDELMAQPGDVRRGYLQALARFNRRFEEICGNNRVERVLVDTSRDMAEVLVDHLNHRSLLNRGR